MTVKLLTAHHLEFQSLKGAAQARLSLHMLKCHIVGNHMSRLTFMGVMAPLHFQPYFMKIKCPSAEIAAFSEQ